MAYQAVIRQDIEEEMTVFEFKKYFLFKNSKNPSHFI